MSERDRANVGERAARGELARSRGTIASQLASSPDRRIEALQAALSATAVDDAPAEAVQGLFDAVTAAPSRQVLVRSGGQIGAFVDGGRTIVLAGSEGHLDWFDAASGARLATAPSTLRAPSRMLVGERWLVVSGVDGVERWDLTTRSSIRLVGHDKAVTGSELVDGGAAVVTVAHDGRAIRYELSSGRELARLTLDHGATSLAAFAGGVVIGLETGGLVVWTGTRSYPLAAAHRREVVGAVVVDHALVTASLDGDVLRWPGFGEETVPTPLLTDVGRIGGVWAGGARLAVSRIDRDVLAIDPRTSILHALPGGLYWGQAMSSNGERVITGSKGVVRVWDAATGAALTRLSPQETSWLALSPDTHRALAIGFGLAAVWDARLGQPTGIVAVHDSEVISIAVSPDRITSASLDGAVRSSRLVDGRWSPAEAWHAGGEIVALAPGPIVATFDRVTIGGVATETQHGITAAISRSGRVLVTALDGTARLWDGPRSRELGAGSTPITAAAWSRDGRTIALGRKDSTVELWDASVEAVPVRQVLVPTGPTGVRAISMSPDGHRLCAAGTSSSILTTGQLTRELPGTCLGEAFSPDGSRVATATPDGRVQVHHVDGPTVVLEGHTALVTSMTWTADGRLITGSVDGTARVWDVERKTAQIIQRGSAVTAIATAEEGRWVLTAAAGVVRLDPTRVSDARERACATLRFLGQHCDRDP